MQKAHGQFAGKEEGHNQELKDISLPLCLPPFVKQQNSHFGVEWKYG